MKFRVGKRERLDPVQKWEGNLHRSTDRASITAGRKAASVHRCQRWVDVVVRACGSSILAASIFLMK